MRKSLRFVVTIILSVWCLQYRIKVSAETFKQVTLYTSQINISYLARKASELVQATALTVKKSITDSNLSTSQLQLLGRYCPRITFLDLSNSGAGDAHMVLLAKQFPVLTTLDVSSLALTDTGFKTLSSSLFAPRLSGLTLSYTKLTSKGFALGLKRFTGLKTLGVFADGGNFKDAGFAALAASPCASRLTGLMLYSTGITDQEFIRSISKFASLTSLNLKMNNLGNKALAALASTRFAPQLSALNLDNNALTDAGLTATVLRKFTGLKSLNIAGSAQVTLMGPGLKALALAPFAGQLTSLGLSATGIKSQDFAYIRYFRSLTSLDISKILLTDVGLKALSQAPCAEHLTSLKLGFGVSSSGFSSAIKAFKNLMSLDISLNTIGDRGFKALVDAPCAEKLITLVTYKTGITRTSLAYLKKFTRLKNINIGGNSLGDAGLAILANSALAPKLITLYAPQISLTASGFAKSSPVLNKLSQLGNLDLSYNTIEYAGFEVIAKTVFAPKLQSLTLRNIGSKQPLATSSLLKNFKQLQKASF